MQLGYELESPRTAGEIEHVIESKVLTVLIPPAGLALMARIEVDLGAIGELQLDLNDTIGAARGANQ